MSLEPIPHKAGPRNLTQVNTALAQLEKAITAGEKALEIPVPRSFIGINKGDHNAAVDKRKALLAPAAADVLTAVETLHKNDGYNKSYRSPYAYWGDNGEPIESIMKVAAEHPVKYKWRNDFPWQDEPKTSLATMVDTARGFAKQIVFAEANLNIDRVAELTGGLLYDKRVQDLPTKSQQALHDAVTAVQLVRTNRLAGDDIKKRLDTLPAEVLSNGKLTTDPKALEALEQLHRTTVTAHGTTLASDSVSAQLARAKELAAAGKTAEARDIYQRLTGK